MRKVHLDSAKGGTSRGLGLNPQERYKSPSESHFATLTALVAALYKNHKSAAIAHSTFNLKSRKQK